MPREYPVAAGLARHLVESLVERDFDVSYANRLTRERGEGHAFGFVHHRLLGGATLPVVPVVVNTYYPPNQPRPGRCYRFDQALRAGIESWPRAERVGDAAWRSRPGANNYDPGPEFTTVAYLPRWKASGGLSPWL